ncbi:cytochrome c maturation protein CcmE domain-containing protein [Adlercreutzia sp. ZJ141]|uniref:cytochrome c maturation protein CcmE domain-containing protein n=1 Tax=Adlercreutzia sp. ZJ141 TaxID=2709406 RepID=UPI0013ECB450|nr:cytochrome c maturation protein CcmE [Adlercreutzia sp. ZJ141]
MNKKMKRRMVVVTGVIVIVLIIVLAVVGGSSSAKSVTVADVVSGAYQDQKVQVTGTVVDNSFETKDGVLTFRIYDPEGDPSQELDVRFDGGVSATFGNGVVAICTGKMGADGVLSCTELVTKCPSKYENATDALTVEQLLDYGDSVIGKPVKVAGVAKSVAAVGEGDRIVLTSEDGSVELGVAYDGAIPDGVAEGSALVVTGSLSEDGTFAATDVALKA